MALRLCVNPKSLIIRAYFCQRSTTTNFIWL